MIARFGAKDEECRRIVNAEMQAETSSNSAHAWGSLTGESHTFAVDGSRMTSDSAEYRMLLDRCFLQQPVIERQLP